MNGTRQAGLVALPLCLTSSAAVASWLTADHDLPWWSVDGGGGTLSEGTYSLSGTIGQADVGPALENGRYRLVGGYWYGVGEEQPYELYLPSVLKDH